MSLFRKTLLAGGGLAATLGVACGSDGEGDRAVVVLGTADAAPAVQTVVEIPTSTPTPTPEKTPTPTIQGPTETQKAETRAKASTIVSGMVDTSKTIPNPDPDRITPENYKERQGIIADLAKEIDTSINNGKISDARTKLVELKGNIKALGNRQKAQKVPVDILKQHNPSGKYYSAGELFNRDGTPVDGGKIIGGEVSVFIDPQVLPLYLQAIDVLEAFDGQPD